MANAAGADLFASIHLNASEQPVDHGGVATFVLDSSDERQAIRLAARENGTTPAEVTGLQKILAGLHRREQVAASREVARDVQRATLQAGRRILPSLHDRGVKEAMFYVLVGARMPAVLVEASFLTHPEQAKALETERYRQALAEGIAVGLVRSLGR
jgi:N-acetylmuramoyl-L-alanine amidase